MTTGYEDLHVQAGDGVVTITLDRPRVKNAVRLQTCDELIRCLDAAESDPTTRVIVLAHTGRYFSAGGDLAGYTDKPQAAFREYTQAFKRLWLRMASCQRPIVARVEGDVLGGGLGLVAACDLIVSSATARYRCPEIDVGLWPMMLSPILVRVMGARLALDLMMTGRALSAAEAASAGLISRVVAPEEVAAETARVVAVLAAKSPLALRMGRRSFYAMRDMELGQALEYTGDLLALLVFSHDGQEGVRAFLDKRTPAWRGY
ncbi:MAG: enoyl-CoA hydratase/isomerase family protein [Candidatus Rokubacteria bacterium]|nr:enoyl-CoA hydratase/isomerase family protein [Candidatus Rokubacteria bacterium]